MIERTIGGVVHKFELTPMELFKAYREQEHQFDCDDIKNWFEGMDDEEILDDYGVTRKEIMQSVDDMAFEMRRLIDKYEMSFEYAREDAIKEYT